MSEQYKSANYINTGTLMKVQTLGDLKFFSLSHINNKIISRFNLI